MRVGFLILNSLVSNAILTCKYTRLTVNLALSHNSKSFIFSSC